MREVEKNEANYVLIISDAYTKRVKFKFYFDLTSTETVGNMLLYVLDNYPEAIKITSRIEFARVLMGNSLRKEL